jgi:hypothetical protein
MLLFVDRFLAQKYPRDQEIGIRIRAVRTKVLGTILTEGLRQALAGFAAALLFPDNRQGSHLVRPRPLFARRNRIQSSRPSPANWRSSQ